MQQRERSKARTTFLLLCLAAALSPPLAAEETATPPLDRLQIAMRGALGREAAQVVRTGSAADRAELALEGIPGGPVIEIQSEGLGSDFDREPNAVDSLRLRREVTLPSQRASAGTYRGGALGLSVLEEKNALLDLAAQAGAEWLELAAALDLRALLADRTERLDRALRLHEKRLELGEVAGAEVRQLELQRARERARLTMAELEAEDIATRLRRTAGDVLSPNEGDLVAIAIALPALDDDRIDPTTSPWIDAVGKRSQVAEQQADMVRRRAWGLIETEAEVQRIPSLDGASSFESLGFRIAIPLPLGQQGRLRRTAAEARAESVRADSLHLELELERRIEQSRRRVRSTAALLTELEALETDFPRAEHSLSERFRLGAISYLVYVDGLSRLDELREDLIDTRRSLLRARLELAVLMADEEIFPLPDVPEETFP